MWSVKYRIVSEEQEKEPSKCRVCKQQTIKTKILEKQTLRILAVIPIPRGTTLFEVCDTCHARVRSRVDSRMIDSEPI